MGRATQLTFGFAQHLFRAAFDATADPPEKLAKIQQPTGQVFRLLHIPCIAVNPVWVVSSGRMKAKLGPKAATSATAHNSL